jgi:aldose 1-epimerase
MFWNKHKGKLFGMINDKEIYQYTLVNRGGLKANIINYGATITHLYSLDNKGNLGDIILGFDDLDGYLQKGNPFMNAIIGRVANRINQAKYISAGETINVSPNFGKHQLHGGFEGFDKKIWDVTDLEENSLTLEYTSEDGEEGFIGEVVCQVKYLLDDNNQLHIIYKATPTVTTPIILTNHAYFNLSSGEEHDVLNHHLQINSDEILDTDTDSIPTGGLIDVADTPFDLRKSASLREKFKSIDGYDHFWILGPKLNEPKLVATLSHEKSGRYIDLLTTEPGMQVYTSNGWDGNLQKTKGNNKYLSYAGICLETQLYPDSMNHPFFTSPFVEKGSDYHQHTIFHFGIL